MQTISKSLGRVRGADGRNCHIKYNTSASLTGATAQWTSGQNWIGFALTVGEPTAADFRWSQFVPNNVVFNSQIVQTTGNSDSNIMSQRAATDTFVRNAQVQQATGNSTTDLIKEMFSKKAPKQSFEKGLADIERLIELEKQLQEKE